MLTFTIRRLLISIPTLLFISLIIFLLLNLAPNDPMAQVPLTVPPEVKEKMREALGLGQPLYVQFWKWLVQFFWIEPQVLIDYYFGTTFAEGELRVISWQTRSPVMDMIVQRLPQTLWVVGMSYIVGILIALPIGIYSAYRHYSVFDQAGTFITMVGYSIPPFFTGPLVIVVFAVQLGWLPSTYDTLHEVIDWDTFRYPAQTDGVAGDGAGVADHGPDQPLYAGLDAGQPQSGLCAYSACQGVERVGCRDDACVAQFHDPGGHGDCAEPAIDFWRCHHHRTDFQGERHRPAADRCNLCQRPANHPDTDLYFCRADCVLQSPG
jgi:hypothetical protein